MENEKQYKTAFAALLYRQPGVKPFEAALSLFPDTGVALKVSQSWPGDVFVLEEIARFAGEDSEYENRLPGKEQLSREVWSWFAGENARYSDLKDKINAAKLYAEINMMIVKPETGGSNNPVQLPNVMEVPVYGTEQQWEQELAAQQARLQEEGMKEIRRIESDA